MAPDDNGIRLRNLVGDQLLPSLFFFCHLEQTNISWEWQQRVAGNTPIRRKWKENGFMQICTCQGRLMLSKGENVEEKSQALQLGNPSAVI